MRCPEPLRARSWDDLLGRLDLAIRHLQERFFLRLHISIATSCCKVLDLKSLTVYRTLLICQYLIEDMSIASYFSILETSSRCELVSDGFTLVNVYYGLQPLESF